MRSVWSVWLWLGIIVACDRTPTISLTTEDFRFVPDLVRIDSSNPVALSIYNAGREVHEFDSPVLLYGGAPPTGSAGIQLQPGQTVRLILAPPAGTYLYVCRRKGHANMTGTLIVQ
ncbi:MAG TPA: cupredoxin domain-containing protein [Nitrospira sp.]|nr:cupredoxin domain-containing protein [Nitrospira sp.]